MKQQRIRPALAPANTSNQAKASLSRTRQAPRARVLAAAGIALTLVGLAAPLAHAAPSTDHPRIWMRPADVLRYRARAVPSNPLYAQGLAVMAANAVMHMDTPAPFPAANNYLMVREHGVSGVQSLYLEDYAFLFAFLSLVDPDPADRADYAQRARTLLMYVIAQALPGQAPAPFRYPSFGVSDRSRWAGYAFPVVTDWIYPVLSAQDKADIRTVLHRWSQERLLAYNHPVPVGLTNDEELLHLDDPARLRLRNAGNNYAASHMRNLAVTALAFDEADDPPLDPGAPDEQLGNTLRSYLANVTGSWLYVQDYLYRHDALGGMNPEGFEYFPTPPGNMLQVLWALRTSGNDDPAVHGPQVIFEDHPYFEASTGAFLHHLPQDQVFYPSHGDTRYQPAWYGDGERYYLQDDMRFFGYLGLLYEDMGEDDKLEAVRWLQTHTPPGGEEEMTSRARALVEIRDSILYFMLFDPAEAAAGDPRPSMPLAWRAEGLNRISSRTQWDSDASFFTYDLSWTTIDHQFADGNMFTFHRKGEWLTKEHTGYGAVAASSDYHNTLSLQNTPLGQPWANTNFRSIHSARGSQFLQGEAAGDPELVARSDGDGYTYVTGDATNLYNTRMAQFSSFNYTDIAHASRSILWLKPDHIVIYDRAESQTAGRYKRFWMSGPNLPELDGDLSTFTTPGGQKLFVRTLLPLAATIEAVPQGGREDHTADYYPSFHDPMTSRLMVEATGGPASTRFLHVLQGADAGSVADDSVHVQSTSGTAFEGALVDGRAVLFPVDLDAPFAGLAYSVPASTTQHWITGLEPRAGYSAVVAPAGASVDVSITAGGSVFADEGGVLVLGGDELPAVGVHAGDDVGAESGSDPVEFTITRSGATSSPLLVHYEMDGDAEEGADYAALAGSVTIGVGQASAVVGVSPSDDAAFEGSESVELRVTPSAAYHVTLHDRAEGVIADNEAPTGGTLQLASAAFAAAENAGFATITVVRTGASAGAVSVRCSTAHGTAGASDYTPTSQVLSWAGGDTAPKTMQVPLADDGLYEGDETVSIALSPYSLTGASALGVPSSAVLTIEENDTAPVGTIHLAASQVAVGEGAGTLSVVASRVGGDGGAVSVDYAFTAGTASAGADYMATDGMLTWADGDSTDKVIAVSIVSDSLYEGANETLSLALGNVMGGAALGSPSSATITIEDDDPAPAEYDVGDGQPYPTIADVPWASVVAGSTVRIHWRAEPYREKLLLSMRGTAEEPVRIVGVPGPGGERPILDAQNAATAAAFVYADAATAARSLVAVARDAADPVAFKPGYIEIEGLELRGANRLATFTTAAGVPTAYHHSAASIRVEGGEHVTVRDCLIHGSGNGILSVAGSSEASVTRNLTVERCDIHGNGTDNDQNGNNVSAEGVGLLLQDNRFGSPLLGSAGAGAKGINVRTRAAATVIRTNWIEGGAGLIEIVDASSAIVRADAGYASTAVYGNVLRHAHPDGSSVVRYGGDSGTTANYRKGMLFFFHNTVTMRATQAEQFSIRVLRLVTADESVDVRNNILWREPIPSAANLHLLNGVGQAALGRNWISSGWSANGAATYDPADITTGTTPGFVDAAGSDLHLTEAAPARNIGGALHPSVAAEHAVTRQYLAVASSQWRPVDAPVDAGAYEFGIVPECGNGTLEPYEHCEPSDGSCCSDECSFLAFGAECRAGVGPCDVAETCSGIAASCPTDALAPAGSECRASAGACDLSESCDGGGAQCPADDVVAAGTECRASQGACDVPESCDGSAAACPLDVKSVATCRTSAGACDVPESCNGVADACPADAKSHGVCRSSQGVCDAPEYCDGSEDACPQDVPVPDGTACNDGEHCPLADVCMDGVCTNSLCLMPEACLSGIELEDARIKAGADPFKLTLLAAVVIPQPWQAVDPALHGMRVVMEGVLGADLPGGARWKVGAGGTKWVYRDRSGEHGGVIKAIVQDLSVLEPGRLMVRVKAKTESSAPLPEPQGMATSLMLGDYYECGELVWGGPDDPSPSCDGNEERLVCR